MNESNLNIVHLYFADWSLTITLNVVLWAVLVTALTLVYIAFRNTSRPWIAELEIDEAELGIGDQKIRLKPNRETAQIAYKLWIELSTRKVGLPIDFEHDVITDVYDSWYTFFKVTRELLKDIPASQLRSNASTQHLVHIAIEVLNEGLRPHLTSWQARFRRWYLVECSKPASDLDPQALQERYARYDALRNDMESVNKKLIAYRRTVRKIVFGA